MCKPNNVKLVGNFDLSNGSSCGVEQPVSERNLMLTEFKTNNLDGDAFFCLEMSIDGQSWYPANCKSEFLINQNTIIRVGESDANFYRYCYKSDKSTTTMGTIDVYTSFKLNR